MSISAIKKGTLEISAKEKHQGCLWDLNSEKKSPGSLTFQHHPHLLLRLETWDRACLPWGLRRTPNTRGCKHFSSHINRRRFFACHFGIFLSGAGDKTEVIDVGRNRRTSLGRFRAPPWTLFPRTSPLVMNPQHLIFLRAYVPPICTPSWLSGIC